MCHRRQTPQDIESISAEEYAPAKGTQGLLAIWWPHTLTGPEGQAECPRWGNGDGDPGKVLFKAVICRLNLPDATVFRH